MLLDASKTEIININGIPAYYNPDCNVSLLHDGRVYLNHSRLFIEATYNKVGAHVFNVVVKKNKGVDKVTVALEARRIYILKLLCNITHAKGTKGFYIDPLKALYCFDKNYTQYSYIVEKVIDNLITMESLADHNFVVNIDLKDYDNTIRLLKLIGISTYISSKSKRLYIVKLKVTKINKKLAYMNLTYDNLLEVVGRIHRKFNINSPEYIKIRNAYLYDDANNHEDNHHTWFYPDGSKFNNHIQGGDHAKKISNLLNIVNTNVTDITKRSVTFNLLMNYSGSDDLYAIYSDSKFSASLYEIVFHKFERTGIKQIDGLIYNHKFTDKQYNGLRIQYEVCMKLMNGNIACLQRKKNE